MIDTYFEVRYFVGIDRSSIKVVTSPEVGSETHFGEHLMLDAYGGSEVHLRNEDAVRACLSDLPARLGMTILAEPKVHWAQPNGIKDPGGWSGVVIIAESHISIHTFPDRKFASIDVYTCRNGIPVQEVLDFFVERFGFSDLETNFVKRGTRYPAENLVA